MASKEVFDCFFLHENVNRLQLQLHGDVLKHKTIVYEQRKKSIFNFSIIVDMMVEPSNRFNCIVFVMTNSPSRFSVCISKDT